MKRNRLGVFVFYQKEGIVEEYVRHLLESFQTVLNGIVIVVNGKLDEYGEKTFNEFTDKIVMRDNVGYDGGAYKDVFINYLRGEQLEGVDELVLFNNTFFGPFISWDVVFNTMNEKNIDFWGLSKWIGGYSDLLEREVTEHIQGYFIVVSKRMFSDPNFLKYWEMMETPKTYAAAILNFEVSFTSFFSKMGYSYLSWLDAVDGVQYLKMGEVAYCNHAGDLVENTGFPILKKKACNITNFIQIDKILKAMVDNSESDLLFNYVDKAIKENAPLIIESIERFVELYKEIYVYGYGKWGHNFEKYFEFRGWTIKKFIVTQKDINDNSKVISINELSINGNMGIILALGKLNTEQVYPMLSKLLSVEQILVIS